MGGRFPHELVRDLIHDEPVWGNPFLEGLRELAEHSFATAGSGNHFALWGELGDEPDVERLVDMDVLSHPARGANVVCAVVTHHGSRGLGASLYKRGVAAARRWCRENASDIPAEMAWLPLNSPEGADYWEALQYAGRWARANHAAIHGAFLARIGAARIGRIFSEHNFCWKRPDGAVVHGKGATPAWRGNSWSDTVRLIPMNMRDGVLLAVGTQGDSRSFLSMCPHGAGRNRSRTATVKPFLLPNGAVDGKAAAEAVAKQTPGVDVRWWCGHADVSESPIGYKDSHEVVRQMRHFGLAEVYGRIRPFGCVMGGLEPWDRWVKGRV